MDSEDLTHGGPRDIILDVSIGDHERAERVRDAPNQGGFGGREWPGGATQGELCLVKCSWALACIDQFLGRGWKIEGDNGSVRLTHGVFNKVLQFRRNSLTAEAQKGARGG